MHGATDPVLDSISPLKHVKSVDVPVLMIHGTDDTVVAFEQSQDMYKALTQLGKPVELLRLNHEDHWLSSSDTRLQMLQATVDFLRKHSPPD